MGDRIGFCVIGCGAAAWIGHLPWIWEHPEARLVVVCDPDRERAAAVQERYQVPAVATDYREALSLPGVDAVVICTPPASHREIATAAAPAGEAHPSGEADGSEHRRMRRDRRRRPGSTASPS